MVNQAVKFFNINTQETRRMFKDLNLKYKIICIVLLIPITILSWTLGYVLAFLIFSLAWLIAILIYTALQMIPVIGSALAECFHFIWVLVFKLATYLTALWIMWKLYAFIIELFYDKSSAKVIDVKVIE